MNRTADDSDEEAHIAFLLDVLFDHKMVWVQQLLKSKGLSAAGTKPDLRSRIKACLDNDLLATADLIDLLDTIEGWGDQHIYLYKASNSLIASLAGEANLKATLRKLHLLRLFNGRTPVVLPDEPALSAIQWSADRVRFVWVEKRIYRDPRDDQSYVEGSIEYDAYEVKQSRGIVSFSCDLVSGLAELLIQRLPSGNNYRSEQQKYFKELSDICDVLQLTPHKISGAIKKIDQLKGVRKRSSQLMTARGAQVTYTSRSRKDDVYKDPSIRKARKALGASVAGRLGNFYWPILGRDIHIKLYAKDQRIGIFGECTAAEVENVLSQIRGYC
ncbi:MAG TPA: hypothetical protein VGP76_03535 [Planctomycetaceae bacterium]|jgi:hypothetical protein|nr:hypothetical protein [Planctomycetaceae bacterium]